MTKELLNHIKQLHENNLLSPIASALFELVKEYEKINEAQAEQLAEAYEKVYRLKSHSDVR